MTNDCSIIKSRETCICDQTNFLIQSKSDQCINTEHQLLHTRCSFTTFVTDNQNISRHDLASHNCLICILVTFIYFCCSFNIHYFFVDSCRTYNCSCRRYVAAENLKSRLLCYRIFHRMNHLIRLTLNRIQNLTPGVSIHGRRICMKLTGKLFHHLFYTARIMEIYNRIRTTRDNRVDTVNLFCVFFKIC